MSATLNRGGYPDGCRPDPEDYRFTMLDGTADAMATARFRRQIDSAAKSVQQPSLTMLIAGYEPATTARPARRRLVHKRLLG
jgi:hypothetical protein